MARWAPWQGEGGWADADMLPLGPIGIRPSGATTAPVPAHPGRADSRLLTLWVMARSP